MDLLEAYIAVLEVVLLTLVPGLLILTMFSWHIAFRARPYRLPVLLAISNTIIGACATWLSFTILYRSRAGPYPDYFIPITATSVVLLCLVPFLTTSYLAYLETRYGRAGSEQRQADTSE
jgi:hypothetical protein